MSVMAYSTRSVRVPGIKKGLESPYSRIAILAGQS